MTVEHNDLTLVRRMIGDKVFNLCSHSCVRVEEEHLIRPVMFQCVVGDQQHHKGFALSGSSLQDFERQRSL